MANEKIPSISLKVVYVGEDKRPFDLTTIKDGDGEGERLLNALPKELQERAILDAERLYANIKRPITDLPEELRKPGALESFIDGAMKTMRGESGSAGVNLKMLLDKVYGGDSKKTESALSKLVGLVPKAVGGTFEYGVNVGSEAVDWLALGPKAIAYALTSAEETKDTALKAPSMAQLRAVAAVEQAVRYGYAKAPNAPAETKEGEATGVDKAVVGVQHVALSFWDSSWMIPVRAFFSAALNALVGKGFHYGEALAELQAEVAAKGEKSYDLRLAEHTKKTSVQRSQDPVKISLDQITEVAGVKTKPLFDLKDHGGYFVDFYNNIRQAEKGGDTIRTLSFGGAPLTFTAVDDARKSHVTGNIGDNGLLVTAVALPVAGTVAALNTRRALQGVADRALVVPVERLAEQHAKAAAREKMLTDALKAEQAAQKKPGATKNPVAIDELKTKLADARTEVRETTQALKDKGVLNPTPNGDTGKPLTGEARAQNIVEQRTAHLKGEGHTVKAALAQGAQNPHKWYNPGNLVQWASNKVTGAAINTTTFVKEFAVNRVNDVKALGATIGSATDSVKGLFASPAPANAAAAGAQAAPAAKAAAVTPAAVVPPVPGPTTTMTSNVGAARNTVVDVVRQGAGSAKVKGAGIFALVVGGLFGAKKAAAQEFGEGAGEKTTVDKLATVGAGAAAGAVAAGDRAFGVSDAANGDGKGFWLSLMETFTPMPARTFLDLDRQEKAMKAIPADQVSQLATLIRADAKSTGDRYLDQVIKLKQWQARGVKEVAFAPLNPATGYDNMGQVVHEGKAVFAPLAGEMQETTATIEEAIDKNLRLYIVNGGDLAKLEALLGVKAGNAAGALGADAKLSAVVVDATMQARAEADKASKGADAQKLAFANVTRVDGLPNVGANSVTGSRVAGVAQPALA